MLPLLPVVATLVTALAPRPEASEARGAQEERPAGAHAEAAGTPAALSPEAMERWRSFTRAARSGEELAPVQGFDLQAHARTRQGVQTNELDVRYRFLEPHYIRFRLPRDIETGRGPGQRGGFWLREGDEVVELQGRDYAEDRDQVLRMISLARNFIALTDPERIRLERVELLSGPEFDLLDVRLRRQARKLDWVRVASPSFALAEALARDEAEVVYRVDLGLDRESRLPRLVAIQRDVPRGNRETVQAAAEGTGPLLIRLEDFRGANGFVVPHLLFVHAVERIRPRLAFAERPSQEIAVQSVDLRPTWTPEDFLPR